MSQGDSDIEPELAKVILRYYLAHPDAVDTLEGLARWRLLEDRVHHTVTQVEKALDWLIARGFLQKTVRAASPPTFALNSEKRDQGGKFPAGEAFLGDGADSKDQD